MALLVARHGQHVAHRCQGLVRALERHGEADLGRVAAAEGVRVQLVATISDSLKHAVEEPRRGVVHKDGVPSLDACHHSLLAGRQARQLLGEALLLSVR